MQTLPTDLFTNTQSKLLVGGTMDNEVSNGVLTVPSATGVPVEIQAFGDDTDISINIVPKGAGVVNVDATVRVDAIVGGDSSLGITGEAGAAGAAGGAIVEAGGAGGAGATTTAGGAGGAVSVAGGAGGAKAGTGAAAGGAGGASSLVGGVGGATASSGTDKGGNGGDVSIVAGAGGAASAGTGNGGAGGTVLITPGAGGTSAGGTAGVPGMVLTGIAAGGGATGFGCTRSTVTTGATLSAAQLRGQVLYQDASGGNVTMATPIGSVVQAAFPDMVTGQAIAIRCASNNASNTSTLSGASGVTLVGSGAITQTGGEFLLICTGADTFDLVRVG